MPSAAPMPVPSPVSRALAAHEQAPGLRHGAHLADASFRFDAEAPRLASPRPRPGETWTLAQTLQEIRLRGARVQRGTGGLRVRHAHLAADLAEAVAHHEAAVRLWLDLGAPEPVGAWDDETVLHLRWFERRFGGETHALALRPGLSVTDWPRFRKSVAGRFGEGPAAPCAESLRRDLRDLYLAHGRPALRPVRHARPARAA